MSTNSMHRYDFVLFFDVTNGNPNGDPDVGNAPAHRTGKRDTVWSGTFVSSGKSEITSLLRNRKQTVNRSPGYDIYMKEKSILNQQQAFAYTALKDQGLEIDAATGKSKPGNEESAPLMDVSNLL